jgi:uncharacterized protein YlxW (UPF0749 family)
MKVVRIVNDCVNSGANWSQASVELNDGQIVRIFNPVMVGDIVESERNGQYTNWKVLKQSTTSDMDKIVNEMAKTVQKLEKRVEDLERQIKDLTMDKLKQTNYGEVDMRDAPDFLQVEG